MLIVTEDAKQMLKETLQEHSDDPETGIRLSVQEGGRFGISLDSESEGDQVVEHEGAKVLLIAPTLSNVLEGRTMDVHVTEEGPKLYITKGNEDDSKKVAV
jgi:Fe-S cluster assembly iron-binding protein IscA